MTTEATAAIIEQAGGPFRLRPVVLDDLRPDEALVRIQACGICHTDLKFQERLPLPALLGHEGAGVVEAVGAEVEGVRKGDRVVLSYPSCGECPSCATAEPFRCEVIPRLKFGGARADGTHTVCCEGTPITSAFFQQSSFATHAIAHASTLVPVDSTLPNELLAALPCGVQTGAGAMLNTFPVAAKDPVVVIGAGTVGLSAVMAAASQGAAPLITIDPVPARRALALELGATHAFAATAETTPQVRAVMPRGARYVLESSGTVDGLETGMCCLGQGGAIGIVTAPPTGETFPFSTRALFDRVASLHGIVQGSAIPRAFLPRLLNLHQQGTFPYHKLVKTYPFAAINQAVEDIKQGTAVKAVLIMEESAST